MTIVNIRIGIGAHGVTRVTALGRTGQDRSDALAFLTKIEPALKQIDQHDKESKPSTR